MVSDRKTYFVGELKEHYRELISGAHRAEREAGEAVEQIRRDSRKKEDTKSAIEHGRMASGHRRRRQRARRELEELVSFASGGLRNFGPESAVAVGALVDVSIAGDDGTEERTLFVLPVGAGTELTGPGGDGFISVITPASPVGRALSGARAGDSFDVEVAGHCREWTVVDLY